MTAESSIFLFILFTLFVYAQQPARNSNNYGPYNLKFIEYKDCKGPKPMNATIMNTVILENGTGLVNFTFLADTKLEEVRINVYNMAGDTKNFLWSYKINDPCKHFSFNLLIKRFLQSDNCLIKKGLYFCAVNFFEVANALMGQSFFYGNYSFKTNIMSKKANIGCILSTMMLSKKKGG